MAEAFAIAQLRANIGDGDPIAPAFSDAELAVLLDDAAGVEPRARFAALLPLWAEAAGRVDYTTGLSSEKSSQEFAQLRALLTQAEGEVAALDATLAMATREARYAGMAATVAVPVRVVWR